MSLTFLIVSYAVLPWVKIDTVFGGHYGADFSDVHRAMSLGGGSPPFDYDMYFNWFAYVLLIACPLLVIAANLGLPTRALKPPAVVLSVIGGLYTFEIMIHLFVDTSDDRSLHVSGGPWMALLGFTAATIGAALAA